MRPSIITAYLLLTACAAAVRGTKASPAACTAEPPPEALPFDVDQHAPLLAGEFRFISVMTSYPPVAAAGVESRLVLVLADSARRLASRERRFGHVPRGDLQLVGTAIYSDTAFRPEPVEVDGATLYEGCRDCMDASPDVHHIRAVSAEGFWGTWRNYQTGIGRIIDSETGKPGPDPSGYFCALRRSASTTQ